MISLYTSLKMRRICALVLVFLLALIACASNASADPKKARALSKEAGKAYSDGKYDMALDKFTQAYAEDANPALLYNMGRVYESKADFRNAINQYTRFVTSPDVDQDARADALDRIKTLNEVLQLQGAAPSMANTPQNNPAPAKSPAPGSHKSAPAPGGCIDINTANAEQLDELNGIGPAKAKSILEYRNQKGSFKNISELNDINGISEKTLAKFSDQVCPISSAAPAAPAPKPAANTDNSVNRAFPDKSAAPAKPKPAPSDPAKPVQKKDLPVLDI